MSINSQDGTKEVPIVSPEKEEPRLSDPDVAAAFRQKVLQDWTDSLTIAGWRKWHTPFSHATSAITAFCIDHSAITPGQQILDLASGSGEPALSAARATGPTGHVVACDLVPGMLDIAQEQARIQDVENISFVAASMETLPFADASFDRVVCRWGLMFAVDHVRALREMDRVLRPGGRIVIIAWGDASQPFMSPLHALHKRHLLPAPVPDAPTPLKFATPGSLTAAMRAADLAHIGESAPTLPLDWHGTPESFFQWFYDIAAPFRGLFDGLDEVTFGAVREDVCARLRPLVVDGVVRVGAAVVVGVARSSRE